MTKKEDLSFLKHQRTLALVQIINELSLTLKVDATSSGNTGKITFLFKKDVWLEINPEYQEIYLVNFDSQKKITTRTVQGIAMQYGYKAVHGNTIDESAKPDPIN